MNPRIAPPPGGPDHKPPLPVPVHPRFRIPGGSPGKPDPESRPRMGGLPGHRGKAVSGKLNGRKFNSRNTGKPDEGRPVFFLPCFHLYARRCVKDAAAAKRFTVKQTIRGGGRALIIQIFLLL